jgi:hypothetical protein
MPEVLYVVTSQVGVIGTAAVPLWRVPASTSSFGGISLTRAYVWSASAATAVIDIDSFGTTLGTAQVATLGTLNATLVANVQQAIPITTAYVATGVWIGLYVPTGTTVAGTQFAIEYIVGK